VQDLFRFFFAIFKWGWVNNVTYRVFEMDSLKFGLIHADYNNLMSKYCGSQLLFVFVMNAVSLFFIPILTQMIVDPACFYNFFKADSVLASGKYDYKYCDIFGYSLADCPKGGVIKQTTDYPIHVDIPFLYNYSCSSSIIGAYVPLYENINYFVIAKCFIQFLYLFFEVKQKIACRETGVDVAESEKEIGRIKYWFIKTMPMNQLMWDSEEHKLLSKDGSVFPSQSKAWLWKTMPNNLGNIQVLVTFGIMAPLLAITVLMAIFAENYMVELVLGRFLVREMSVIAYAERDMSVQDNDRNIPISNDPVIQKQADDVDQSWGAVAAITELENLCKEVPSSIFSTSRGVILLFSTFTLSFLLNDVANSSANPNKWIYWPSLVMMMAPFLAAPLAHFYYGSTQSQAQVAAPNAEESAVEMTDFVSADEYTSNPIRI
jgi:hypothetical protein